MIRFALGCLLMLAGTAVAAGNVLLVTDTEDDYLAFRPDLRLVAANALNQLRDYEVAPATTQVRPDSDARIEAMNKAALDAGLDTLAVVTLYTPARRTATLTTTFYNTRTGELSLQRALEFRLTDDVPALLAQLEYELPLVLKRAFRELGTVVRVSGDELIFDLGINTGVEVGDLYRVFRRGEEIRDARGDSYGYVDDQSGIIEVVSVSSVYAVAQIKLGRLSIRSNDWVERADPSVQADGTILSKLDDQVAISLGREAGVTPGSYFAVFKTIKPITEDDAFREIIGRIRINSVSNGVARGEIARSDHYDLAKALIEEGDAVEEVSYRHRNQFVVGQNSFSILNAPEQSWFAGFQFDSASDIDLAYRVRGSYGDLWYLSLGLVSAIGHSESFRYGLDGIYGPDGPGTQLFVEVDIPTPLDDNLRFSLESGYLLGALEEKEGVNISLSVKLGLDALF
ncbi:hypothetical protein [Saccharospirillum impatiens]|uniref:hypothetical protein n=1 Tax=Saccharospirillum impatiens TaxID=169438 RepID=UPI00041606AB|nr:hypothetical protein [Saccharospirillum impatiens]